MYGCPYDRPVGFGVALCALTNIQTNFCQLLTRSQFPACWENQTNQWPSPFQKDQTRCTYLQSKKQNTLKSWSSTEYTWRDLRTAERRCDQNGVALWNFNDTTVIHKGTNSEKYDLFSEINCSHTHAHTQTWTWRGKNCRSNNMLRQRRRCQQQ